MNSYELLNIALEEVRNTLKIKKFRVEIELDEKFPFDESLKAQLIEKLEIDVIIEQLKNEFKEYNIKSVIKWKNFSDTIFRTPRDKPLSDLSFPLVWVLTFREKISDYTI